MSFAGILGAGLLGGAANAAQGIGDRIREEAKQKRAELLQDRAEKKAQGLAKTENDNKVEAAKQLRINQATRDRINNAALIKRDNNNAFNQAASQDDQQEFTGGQNANNNIEALKRITASKVGDPHTFFDADNGSKYVAIRQEDGSWKTEGGSEAATSASKGSYTLQNINIDGKDVSGFMDGKTWVTIGQPVAKSSDADSPKSGWTEKSATDYFTKQAYDQLGIKVSDLGVILGDVSETDFNKARKWIAVATDRYTGTGNVESPGAIVAEVFNDEYHTLQVPTASVKASALKAINSGVNKASVRLEVEAKGYDSSFLD